MVYLIAGVGLFLAYLYFGKRFVAANPANLAKNLKTTGGVALILLAVVLGVTGRLGLAVPAALFGATLLGLRGGMGGWGGWGSLPGRRSRTAGQRSQVRTALIEMVLEDDSGRMTGTVLAGSYSGRDLDSLSPQELKGLWREAATDPDSRALAEAYLDRRLAGWRVDFEADGADRHGGAASAGSMTDQEAHQILGLAPGASEAEIRAAHRRLMKRLHPDQGGSTFLAAKLNEAKDKLLGGH